MPLFAGHVIFAVRPHVADGLHCYTLFGDETVLLVPVLYAMLRVFIKMLVFIGLQRELDPVFLHAEHDVVPAHGNNV